MHMRGGWANSHRRCKSPISKSFVYGWTDNKPCGFCLLVEDVSFFFPSLLWSVVISLAHIYVVMGSFLVLSVSQNHGSTTNAVPLRTSPPPPLVRYSTLDFPEEFLSAISMAYCTEEQLMFWRYIWRVKISVTLSRWRSIDISRKNNRNVLILYSSWIPASVLPFV